jgi:Tfp pilus assembly protein PilX
MIDTEFNARDERGFVVVATLLALLLLVSLAISGLTYSTLETRSTAHFDTGNQAFAAAESGVLEALSTMNRKKVINFQNDVVNQWSSLYGTGTKSMNGAPSVQYQVSVAADAGAPANRGTITVTGYAPLSAKRVISVGVNRSGTGDGIGAIYIAATTATSTFNGNAFLIDGNNHTTSGASANDGVSKPGIATYASQVASNVIGSLSTQQKDNVVGQGFSASPLTPSVINSGGPSVADLTAIAQNVLALGGVVTNNSDKINGTMTFGTLASPQITRLTNSDVKITGNMSGAGILVADGNVTVQGSMEFIGWVLALGTVESLTTGNATIYGSLWTSGIQIRVGGSAIVGYCSNCLNLADGLSTTGILPRTMSVSSWKEVI